jgi:hypothetical protein
LGHNSLARHGPVQDKLALMLVEPYRPVRAGAAGELTWLAVVEPPAALGQEGLREPRLLATESKGWLARVHDLLDAATLAELRADLTTPGTAGTA